ncbi:outer mitochondrial membrane protein porin [Grosmannia clavigera kw1407]|uniref:Outer mitochondrial membrane protein porin n=1 Tax=Grosmannia clavigera (strain kw1407 / UAMH 11150) TaxID=655863 RepID=F0XCY9_GROCL|nr:outer mitochondrial membrane protein porin [Grosmannia clavigera kw1407]EFX04452.1 outer mitochondrial membrane protein porin [Grosmannia clavigera kw1407]
MSVPNFSDIAKAANDLLNKDFYHLSAGTLEVKSNTPNNVAFKVSGKNSHEKSTSGVIEGRFVDKSLGTTPPSTKWAPAQASAQKQAPAQTQASAPAPAHAHHISSSSLFSIPSGYASNVESQGFNSEPKSSGDFRKAESPKLFSFPSKTPSSTAPTPLASSSRSRTSVYPPSYDPCLAIYPVGGWHSRSPVDAMVLLTPRTSTLLMRYSRPGLSVTQTWNTANALESRIELADSLAKGLKAEGIFSFLPATQARGAKFNLHFKQSNFHGRAFFDLLKGPIANVDAVIGHDGFVAGATAGYNVNKAAVTNYSAAVGYLASTYSTSVTASDNLSVFAASYHHKVNSQVEAGAKAVWNSKSGNTVGLEVATKYRLDPLSFVKAKINDRGVAAVAYNVLLREGVTFGIGASFDTQKLDQATHKIGTSFSFQA